MNFNKQHYFWHLSFLMIEPHDSIKTAKTRRNEAIHIIKGRIEEDLEQYLDGSLSISTAYRFFAALAILVSKEFAACLEALINNEWAALENIFSKEKQNFTKRNMNWGECRTKILEEILITLSLNWQTAWEKCGEAPVRILEQWEKKLYFEQVGFLKPTLDIRPENTDKNGTRQILPRNVFNRIHISIDPLTPVETITKAVTKIIKEKQKIYLNEVQQSWENELESGAVDNDFITRGIVEARSFYDFKRDIKEIKRTRGGSTFEIWLRSLLVFDKAHNHGMKGKDIAQQQFWKGHSLEHVTASMATDKRRAKKLIEAAIKNIPLSLIKTD